MNIKDYGSAKHLCTTCTSIRPCGTLGRTSFIDSFIHQVILERFLLYAPALTIRKGLRKTNHYSRQEAMWNLFSSPGVPTKYWYPSWWGAKLLYRGVFTHVTNVITLPLVFRLAVGRTTWVIIIHFMVATTDNGYHEPGQVAERHVSDLIATIVTVPVQLWSYLDFEIMLLVNFHDKSNQGPVS